MDKLPKVFANPINKNIDSEQKYFRSNKDVRNSVSIADIDNILSSNNHIYRTRVKVNGVEKVIIKRVNNYLLTIDNERININDINSFDAI